MTVEASTKFQVVIVYNGGDKPLEVESHEQVTAVLQRAIHLFGITQQPHTFSLYREDGTKVPENESASQAGLTPGTVLLLRPDAVKGGAR